MDAIDVGSLVVLHCANPREKMWGVVLRLDEIGIVLRGLDLMSVEDWLSQQRAREPVTIGPSTFFVPMHRLQRLDLDESSAVVKSYADRYASECGGDVREALRAPVDDSAESAP